MFIPKKYSNDITENTNQLINELKEFTNINDTNISIYANCANHLKHFFNNKVNWIGFYLVIDKNLHLGPFNGLPAVTFIKNKEGVCGTCLNQETTIVVDNVCNFENHITCDLNSKSEICVPVFNDDNQMIALLDIDSPNLNTFNEYQTLLEKYINNMQKYLKF